MSKACGAPLLNQEQVQLQLKELHADWRLNNDNTSISRRYEFKGFAKAVYLSNLCVWLADQEGHHPDIAFGWGYCNVTLTTHESSGLTMSDFAWAAKLDAVCEKTKS